MKFKITNFVLIAFSIASCSGSSEKNEQSGPVAKTRAMQLVTLKPKSLNFNSVNECDWIRKSQLIESMKIIDENGVEIKGDFSQSYSATTGITVEDTGEQLKVCRGTEKVEGSLFVSLDWTDKPEKYDYAAGKTFLLGLTFLKDNPLKLYVAINGEELIQTQNLKEITPGNYLVEAHIPASYGNLLDVTFTATDESSITGEPLAQFSNGDLKPDCIESMKLENVFATDEAGNLDPLKSNAFFSWRQGSCRDSSDRFTLDISAATPGQTFLQTFTAMPHTSSLLDARALSISFVKD